METQNTAVALHQQHTAELSVFSSKDSFEHAQRVAMMLSKSTIVPKDYQNEPANCLVALEMAGRIKESPLMIMQNLDIIHGKPGFNGKFVIAKINTCGQFSPLRFEYSGEGDARSCVACATEIATGQVLRGPSVSVKMAKDNGWWTRANSKWPTMTETMLMWRAGKYFGNMYTPEITIGMPNADEILDIEHEVISSEPGVSTSAIDALNETPVVTETTTTKPQAKAGAKAAAKKKDPITIPIKETPVQEAENKAADATKVTERPETPPAQQTGQENAPDAPLWPDDDNEGLI